MVDYTQAEQYCRLLLEELPENRIACLTTLIMLGRIAEHSNRREEACTRYEQVTNECKPDTVKEKLLSSIAHNNLATMHFETGDYNEAKNEFWEKFLSSEHQMWIDIHSNLASCFGATGDLHGALRHLEKAFALCQKLLPENDPTRASIEGNLGTTHYEQGRQEEAIKRFNNALSIHKRCMPSNQSSFIIAHLESALEIEHEHGNIISPLLLASTLTDCSPRTAEG